MNSDQIFAWRGALNGDLPSWPEAWYEDDRKLLRFLDQLANRFAKGRL